MDQTKKPDNNTSGNRPEYQVPVEGSLGLLALGAVGIIAWRKRKQEWMDATPKQDSNTQKNG